MDFAWHTGQLAADQQDIAANKAEIRIGKARLGRQQNEPPPRGAAPGVEGTPMGIAGDLDMVEIIHAGPAEMLVGRRKSGGLDNRRGEPETGAHPQNRARVLRNVWLIKRHCKGRYLVRLHICLLNVSMIGERH